MELNKAVLDCMQTLRRRLREELNQDIRLSQPDVVETMLLACLRSTEQETRDLGIRLAELSDFHGAGKPVVQNTYRSPATDLPTELNDTSSSGSVRMYRGQRVYA